MSDLPPTGSTPPPTDMGATPPPPKDPMQQVQMPAIALLVVAGLGIVWGIFVLGMRILGLGGGFGLGGYLAFLSGTAYSVFSLLVTIILAGIIAYGALRMKTLRDYNMALAAAVVAIIPCFGCCCAGIPVGIWALIVLMKPEVKAAFSNSSGSTAI